MIDNKYFIQWKIGAGGSSDVYLVADENDNKFAVKIIRKQQTDLNGASISTLQKEYFIMEMLSRHPNILKWVESVWGGEFEHNGRRFTMSYNITEYASNGALSSYIRRTGCFDEWVGRFYVLQLASAVAFMHEWRIAHLDIKPPNIVFDSNFNLKLMDFGIAEFNPSTRGVSKWRKGTEGYMAPEVANFSSKEEYDVYKADVYSLGVTIHLMLFGCYPGTETEWWEGSSTHDSVMTDENNEEIRHQSKVWWKNDFEVMELIKLMVNPNPCDRPSIRQVMSHPWFHDSSLDISEEEVYREMSIRKEVAFPQTSKFNFEFN